MRLKDDDIINWYNHLKKGENFPSDDFYLVDPIYFGNLLNTSEGEIKDQRINDLLKWIENKRFIFIPLNPILGKEGQHWSLLLGVKENKKITFYHYNSLKGIDNLSPFLPLLEKISRCLGNNDKITVREKDTPQQENGDDCGVFVCGLTEILINTCQFYFGEHTELTLEENKELLNKIPRIRTQIAEWNKELVEIKEGKLFIGYQEITEAKVNSIIDYYDIPGINRSLSTAEIETRLKKIRDFVHPDRGKWERGKAPAWSSVLFDLVASAKNIIGESHPRQKYDFGLGRIEKGYFFEDWNDLDKNGVPKNKSRNHKEVNKMRLETNTEKFIKENINLVKNELIAKGFSGINEVIDYRKAVGRYRNTIETIDGLWNITKVRGWEELYFQDEYTTFKFDDGSEKQIKLCSLNLSWTLTDLIYRAWENRQKVVEVMRELETGESINKSPVIKSTELENTHGVELEVEIKNMVIICEGDGEWFNDWLGKLIFEIQGRKRGKTKAMERIAKKVDGWTDFSEKGVDNLKNFLTKVDYYHIKWTDWVESEQTSIFELIENKIKENHSPSKDTTEKSDTLQDNWPISETDKTQIEKYLKGLIFDTFASPGTPKLPSAIKKEVRDSELNFTEFAAAATWGKTEKARTGIIRDICEIISLAGGSDDEKAEKVKKVNKHFIAQIWKEIETEGIKWTDLNPPHQKLLQKFSKTELTDTNFCRELVNRKVLIMETYKNKTKNVTLKEELTKLTENYLNTEKIQAKIVALQTELAKEKEGKSKKIQRKIDYYNKWLNFLYRKKNLSEDQKRELVNQNANSDWIIVHASAFSPMEVQQNSSYHDTQLLVDREGYFVESTHDTLTWTYTENGETKTAKKQGIAFYSRKPFRIYAPLDEKADREGYLGLNHIDEYIPHLNNLRRKNKEKEVESKIVDLEHPFHARLEEGIKAENSSKEEGVENYYYVLDTSSRFEPKEKEVEVITRNEATGEIKREMKKVAKKFPVIKNEFAGLSRPSLSHQDYHILSEDLVAMFAEIVKERNKDKSEEEQEDEEIEEFISFSGGSGKTRSFPLKIDPSIGRYKESYVPFFETNPGYLESDSSKNIKQHDWWVALNKNQIKSSFGALILDTDSVRKKTAEKIHAGEHESLAIKRKDLTALLTEVKKSVSAAGSSTKDNPETKPESISLFFLNEVSKYLSENPAASYEKFLNFLRESGALGHKLLDNIDLAGIDNSSILEKFKSNEEDSSAQSNLDKCGEFKEKGFVAYKSTPDNNCFFNAFSRLLVGDETLAVDLRWEITRNFILGYPILQTHGFTTEWSDNKENSPKTLIKQWTGNKKEWAGGTIEYQILAQILKRPIYVLNLRDNGVIFRTPKTEYLSPEETTYSKPFWIAFVGGNHYVPVLATDLEKEKAFITHWEKLDEKEIWETKLFKYNRESADNFGTNLDSACEKKDKNDIAYYMTSRFGEKKDKNDPRIWKKKNYIQEILLIS